MSSLAEEISSLEPALRERLESRGFRDETLLALASTLGGDPVARNRLRGVVEPVPESRLALPVDTREARALGRRELESGRVAACVLAGGMATRMGGVVKALVEVLPGVTFLDARLAEVRALRAQGVEVPLWLMTSEATNRAIGRALGERPDSSSLARTFEQFSSLRLEPSGRLFRIAGEPSPYATGHGDLVDALRASGLLRAFVAGGGRHVWISNLDNVGVTVDEALLGHHVASGAKLTAELVERRPGDSGGGPVLLDGRPIITELFRLPRELDSAQIPVFNTNSFLVDAVALEAAQVSWTYLEVHKDVDGRVAVQFERLLGELTTALDTRFVRVPRDGLASRFLPVKTARDLGHVEAVLRARWVGDGLTPR
ncbi:MAG: UTP--glucose-1-phosphate uridylyltransferase [Deltaproteobacteria bacterium]|nr:UTP--glucose-1-phosphate uridylyltransferase [Deltaproteobacteria bacterium]